MRWTTALLALVLSLLSGGIMADDRQWKLISDRDGVKVYRAHNDDSQIKSFRGITTIELQDFYAPIAIFDDPEYLPRWLYLIRDLKEIQRRSATDRDYHVLTKLPWPVADRDAGLHFTFRQDSKTHEIQILFKTRADIVPLDKDYVRIPDMVGHLKVLPLAGKTVQISFEVLLDPGGYIPAFLVNFILKDIPFVSLQRLRRILNMERFQGHPVDYIIAPEPWASMPPTKLSSGR